MATWRTCVCAAALVICGATSVPAATIYVAAGADLQGALDRARPGDEILLAESAEFVGNFVLPLKTGDGWITVRSAAPDTLLPAFGRRVRPSDAALLARLRSPNSGAALRTDPGAHHWRLEYLEFRGNQNGYGDIIQLGDGSAAQNSVDRIPHHLQLRHLYVHGDPIVGQKRCIALNAAHVTIRDSHVSDCKAVGQDSQGIAGWNGPGPFIIENNYIEAAGENFLLGGADPAIAGLVSDGVTFRGNHVTRPMAWREPLVPTPQGVTAAAVSGGSLPAGTYGYRIVARRPVGQGTTGRSRASVEAQVTTTASGAVRVRWQAVTGASEYRVYGRTPAGQRIYWSVTGTEFVDTGASGISEAVPTSAGTVWSVKNLFELKNARNVVVEGNIFENHWKESQPGYAIVLTPRNQDGGCTWCVIEHVRFEHNIVRNVAAGINLLGHDVPSRPTLQTNDVTVQNNLFTGMSSALGGNAWFLLIGDAPRNVKVARNTVDSTATAVVYTYGGTSLDPREITGFEMSANAARHGSYGFNGEFFSYGNGILNGFYPGAVFASNYLAGAPASRYPAGTLVSGSFPDQFVNAAAGDYAIRPGSLLDGRGIGADFPEIVNRTSGVVAGHWSPNEPDDFPLRVPPTAEFIVSCSFLDCVFTDMSIAGGTPIVARTWTMEDGVAYSAAEQPHRFRTAGTYVVALAVTAGDGQTGTISKEVVVTAPVPPSADFSVTCTYLVCAAMDSSAPGSGAIASRTWNFGDGSPAAGPDAGVSHQFASAGTYTIELRIVDENGLAASASRTVAVEPPNLPPVAAFTAACVDLVCTLIDGSSDVDGRVLAHTWTMGGQSASEAVASVALPAPGLYDATLTVTDDDGARATTTKPVRVTGLLHAGYRGTTSRWSSASGATNYWSASVVVAIHGANERPVAGATVSVAWSGAVVKTATCVTDAAGTCSFASGTLSYLRSSVTLTVSGVLAADSVFDGAASHDAVNATMTALTLRRP